MPNQHLVIMLKAPRQGQVKTRLAKEIGPVAATAFYRRTCACLISRLSKDPRWKTHLAIAPDTSLTQPFWPSKGINRITQGTGNLGQRMQKQFLQLPPGPVLIIGTDIPEINPTHINKAFRKLSQKTALVGPSGDGGYWIIGQKRSPKIHDLFQNVRWSSPDTLTDTLKNLDTQQWALADCLEDVDNKADYLKLSAHSRTLIKPLSINPSLK